MANEDFELVTVSEEQLQEPEPKPESDPGTITLTKEELDNLKRARSSEEALANGLKEISAALKPQQMAMPVQQMPGESPEEYSARLEKELFEPGKGAKAIEEAVGRYVGPVFGQYSKALTDAHKRILQLDPEKGPVYKKFGDEIEQEARALVPKMGYTPELYEEAFNRVVLRKQPEIIAEQAAALAAKMLDTKLQELGYDPEKAKRGVKPIYTDGASVTGSPKRQIRITSQEAARIGSLIQAGLSDDDARRTVLGARYTKE